MFLKVFINDENSYFDTHYPYVGVKRLNRLRGELFESKHKFHLNFQDTGNCYFIKPKLKLSTLASPLIYEQRTKLLENFLKLDYTVLSHCDNESIQILIYELSKYSFPMNNEVLSHTFEFLESTNCVDKHLF